jgi:hypothetical protein
MVVYQLDQNATEKKAFFSIKTNHLVDIKLGYKKSHQNLR